MTTSPLPFGDRAALDRARRAADLARPRNLAEVELARREGFLEVSLTAHDGLPNQVVRMTTIGETVAYLYGLESAWIEARNAAE